MGLYVAPPERAIVFSFNEKSQIQALDRTQPGLPLKRRRADTIGWLKPDSGQKDIDGGADDADRPHHHG